MFAGAQYRIHAPVRVGDKITRQAKIENVTEKLGRSGMLVFVKLTHQIHTQAGLAFGEDHDIVFRGESGNGTSTPVATKQSIDAPWRRTITPDPVLLFRYSAVTFNGHRIHYDRTYATQTEHYPGLVVHGPLIATLLLELARAHAGDKPLASFNFRAKRPLFDTAPFELIGGPADAGGFWLKALDPDGRTAMEADGIYAG
jgi:3-methylfumaryl-CoA hydratase